MLWWTLYGTIFVRRALFGANLNMVHPLGDIRDLDLVVSNQVALAFCRAHRGLPVGFLLFWYSVLFTVESLSLLYLLVIS